MVQQIPDAGMEVARHPLQGPEPQAMLQPAAAFGQIFERIGRLPTHATAQVQLLLALQGGPGMLHVGEYGPQAPADRVGRLAAEGFEGVAGAEIGLGGQFTGEQQQQLAELQGEAAAEQVRFQAYQSIERQQQLLLQHPFAAVFATEAADHGGDGAAALGFADQRFVGVVATHHHLLLAHQQIDQGILQLGMHQPDGAGGAPHHTPIGCGQAAAVHLLEQQHQGHPRGLARPLQPGGGAEPAAQQFEHLGLLRQGGAVPEPLGEISHGGVFELLLLAGGELVLAGAGGQQGCACGPELAGGNCLSGQLHQVGLLHQFRQRGQPDRHTFELAALQLVPQVEKGLGILLEGGGGDRNQQQGRAGAPPIALQQAQLAGHGINEQLGIVGQVIGVVFEHRRQVGDQLVVVAVEASGGHGFHPHPRMAAEPQPGVGSHRGHALAQFP